MIFQMKSWEGWSARQRMTRRPTVVHLLLVTGFIFSQRWTLSSFYLMPTWAFEFFIAFCPAAPLRALQGYELQLKVLLFRHLQTLARLFLATCEQMKLYKNTNTLQTDLTPSVFSSEIFLEDFSETWWTTKTCLNRISYVANGMFLMDSTHLAMLLCQALVVATHPIHSASDMICCCLERTMPSIVDG